MATAPIGWGTQSMLSIAGPNSLARYRDELFARKPAQEGILAAEMTGIEFLPPVLHGSGVPSQQVAQLRIATVLGPGVDELGLQPVTYAPHNEEWRPTRRDSSGSWSRGFPYCGRRKYHAMRRGSFRIPPGRVPRGARRCEDTRVVRQRWRGISSDGGLPAVPSYGSGGQMERARVRTGRIPRLTEAEPRSRGASC